VTAVCANSRPFIDALALISIFVLPSMIPSKCAPVPILTLSDDCQKMFLACAPPVRIILVPLACLIPLAIWKIQTSYGPPLRVTSEFIETPVPH